MRWWIAVMVVWQPLVSWAGPSEPLSDSPESWSVMLITIDALRADRMGVYGYDRNTTPYLDRLAEEAVVFDNAFSTGGWTSPGMVSMLTGYTPIAHQQAARHTEYDAEMPSAIRVLKGYKFRTIGHTNSGGTYGGLGIQQDISWGSGLDALIDHWLEKNHDRFFTWVHIKPTHLPYDPSAYNLRRFRGDMHTSAAIEAVKSSFVLFKDASKVPTWLKHPGEHSFDETDIATVRNLYDGCVADADDILGRAIERMRETGLLERTIVIITADHGDELFEHGWVGHASTGYEGTLYDELTHIPLIIRVPGGRLKGHRDALVEQTDVMPTVFELLGLAPDALEVPMQGHSLVGVMEGRQKQVREFTVAHSTRKGWTTPEAEVGQRITAVRSKKHKLIRWPDGRMEGFDLTVDPREQNDLYATMPADFAALESAMSTWEKEGHGTAAALLLVAGERRLEKLRKARNEGKLDMVLEQARAIEQMHRTWSYPNDSVFDREPLERRWASLRKEVAEEVRAAMLGVAK